MRIKKVEVRHLQIPLKVKFTPFNDTKWYSNSILLELETIRGILGYGESAPRSNLSGENFYTVRHDIYSLNPILTGREFLSIEEIKSFILDLDLGPEAICALELALLDAWSKENEVSLIQALGEEFLPEIQCTGVVPLVKIHQFSNFLNRVRAFNFSAVKLYIDSNLMDTITKIMLIRAAKNQPDTLRIDANGTLTSEQTLDQIPVFLDHNIRHFEQLVPVSDEASMSELTKRFGDEAFIIADESVTTFKSAVRHIHLGLCNQFNLKLSKQGGIFRALRIYELAQRNGIKCQLGAHFGETSILTAAALLFASIAPGLCSFEGAFGLNILEKDIAHPALSFDKEGKIKDIRQKLSPFGLGIEVLKQQSALSDSDMIKA